MQIYTGNYKEITLSEVACKCRYNCGFNAIPQRLADMFMVARRLFGEPIRITSACRCERHNRDIGSQPTSSHIKGLALDLQPVNNTDFNRQKLAFCLGKAGFDRIGFNTASRFVHVDIDTEKANAIFSY
jgi:uncharacterized protein YcbK (DUF882 family)